MVFINVKSFITRTYVCIWLMIRYQANVIGVIYRVNNCINAGVAHKIDPAVDGGLWVELKTKASTSSIEKPYLPIAGWKDLESSKSLVPRHFNEGHIYHYLVESAQKTQDAVAKHDNQVDEEMNSGDSEVSDTEDYDTSKSLSRGKLYLSSGHISDVKEHTQGSFYFAKCSAKPSLQGKGYTVTCTLSLNSGFVVDASCMCVASAMSRCAHISGLLHLLLHEATCHSSDQTDAKLPGDIPCTSKPKSWGLGKKKGHTPKRLHEAKYGTYKEKKIDQAIDFDPRPPSLRHTPSDSHINSYVKNLQAIAKKRNDGEPCMLETSLRLQYQDYTISDQECTNLAEKCKTLTNNLRCGYPFECCDPIEVCKEQGSEEWYRQRRVRITASVAHQVVHMKSDAAITTFLKTQLWDSKQMSVAATRYGQENEPNARQQYTTDRCSIDPNYQVLETGFWVHPRFPELGCSPDGLVNDPSFKEDERGERGLLEIKCPHMLKDHNIEQFESVLNGSQLRSFCLEKRNGRIALKLGHKYYYQVQMQLGIMEMKWCDFVVWSNKSYIVDRIYYNDTFWNDIKFILVSFHHSKICPEFFEMKIPRNLPYVLNKA